MAFVGVACHERSGNNHMAHSRIVVVMVLSLTFEINIVRVLHGFPFGHVGFHLSFSIAVHHCLLWCGIVCFCLL